MRRGKGRVWWPYGEGANVVRVETATGGLDPPARRTREEGRLGRVRLLCLDVGILDDLLVYTGAVDCGAFLMRTTISSKVADSDSR